jgi:GntR family transcriptional regulator / MocR family aminotransferase
MVVADPVARVGAEAGDQEVEADESGDDGEDEVQGFHLGVLEGLGVSLMDEASLICGPLVRSGPMARSRTSSDLELLLPLRHGIRSPLHRQLEHGLRDAIRSGRLAPGATLPSSRALAAQLDVSRGVVVEAYEQLVAEGYLVTRRGGATRVARPATPESVRRAAPAVPAFDIDVRPGRPDVALFPRDAWLRSVRRVLNEAPSERLSYIDGRGIPELRAALAAYLNRVRGTAADADDMVICTGFTQGLRLVALVLRASGARRIALEVPGQNEARATVAEAGLEVVSIPVDEAGIRVDLVETADPDAVLVTSAHQYPTGAVLPPERRAALVEWARRRGRLIIEDDYDAEFRYDREPIGAMHGLERDHVVYVGSASKILAPGLRLGWLVVPPAIADQVAKAKKAADLGSAAIDQLAFADFVSRGELDRHLRRMRPIYRRRRDALIAALRRHLPDLEPVGASAGLHVLVWLQETTDGRAIAAAAEAAGIGLETYATAGLDGTNRVGIIFGYGVVDERTIDDGMRRFAGVLASARAASGAATIVA